MIVRCAYCGFLGTELFERLGERAWAYHVSEHHPDWLILNGWPPQVWKTALIDGEAVG